MAKLSLLLLVLFGFIGISHGFVMGTFGTYTDFFERIEARNGAKLVLRPTFSNGNVVANLAGITYATYDPDTWCTTARLGQVNVFQSETDFSGVPILVLCTRRGGQVFTSKPSPAYKLIPTFNKYYLGPDLANREFTAGNDICSERLGPLYEESSALELLLSVPANRHLLSPQVSRQYASPDVGGRWSDRPYKDIFYAGDLSGVSARFWGATEWLDHKVSPPVNDPELIQFSVTDAPVYPTSSNPLYHLEYFARNYVGTPRRPLGSSQVSCTHIEAPIKFLSTPLQQSTNSHVYGVDALSDWSTYWWLVFNEPSQSNSPVAPIHDVLFPATMTREKKDEWCEILAGPTYHAATAAQVQLALQSAFNPLGSTLTFRASPAECLVSTCTNASEFAWKFLPHDGWPNDLINYNYLSYYQKCLSASFVVADSCQPLAPVSTMADYDLRVCNNKASNEATLPSNRDACMPRLLPAQTVLDACLDRSENFPCISRCGHTNANNDTNRPGDSNDPNLQCSRAVDCPVDAGQKQSWLLHTFANSGGNLDNTDFGTITYEQRKAIFGYLACTNLPRPAEGYPADRDPYKVFNYSFEDGVEAGRLFDPTVSGVAEYTKCDYGCCSDKDNVCQTSLFPRGLVLKGLTPDEPARANRLPYSDSNGIPLPFWDTGADRYGSVSIFSATAWRIEPRRNIATLDANTLFSLSVTFTFPDEANHIVWFNGCGYDDDCYTSSSLPPMYSKDLPNAASFTEFPLTLTTTTETLTATFNFPGDCAIFAVAGWETDQSGGVDFNPGPTSASYTYSIAPSK